MEIRNSEPFFGVPDSRARPALPPRIIGVHSEENSQGTSETLRLLFEKVRSRLALESGTPKKGSLFLISIELLGEGVRSCEAVEETEELGGGEEVIHSLLFLLRQNRRTNRAQHLAWSAGQGLSSGGHVFRVLFLAG